MSQRFADRVRTIIVSILLLVSLLLASTKPSQAEGTSGVGDLTNSFTMMPLFLPDQNGVMSDNLLATMVKDQGYEAHCAAIKWTIDKKLFGAIEKFFSQDDPWPKQTFYKGLNPTIFDGIDPYIVDLTKARTPMFRKLEASTDTKKNSSLEGMFGANYQNVYDQYMLNASGVSNRVLSSYQQCLVKTQNMLAIKKICKEVTDDCTIDKKYNFDVKGTDGQSVKVDFKITDLLDWFAKIRPNLSGDELYQQVCFDITSGKSTGDQNYQPPAVEPNEIIKLREAVGRISTDLDTLYRLAFLVLAPTQDEGKSNPGSDKFYFLQNSPQIDAPVHAPIFIAFKIPDFGTNKSINADNIDTLEITKMVIQQVKQNEKDTQDQKDKRELIYKSALEPTDKVVHCPYPRCAKPLESTLLSIINGSSTKCNNDTLRIIESSPTETSDSAETAEANAKIYSGDNIAEHQASASAIEYIFNQEDLNWERAGDLFTPASKDMRTYNYNNSLNTYLANRLDSKFIDPFEWQLIIDQDPPPLGAPMGVNAYLVLPVGENIKDVNKALSIFWNEDAFFDMIRNNVIEDMTDSTGASKKGAIPKYYTIKDTKFGIAGTDAIRPVDECKTEVFFENGKTVKRTHCSHYTFGFGLTDTTSKNESSSKGELLLPDFGLGFMTRKIQQKLRNTINQTYDYILSCQRVEDMFLGRCKGNPIGKTSQTACTGEAFKNIKNIPSADGVPQFAKDTFTADIAPLLTPDLIAAYEYAEKETGIPCEVVAGIHWTEAGLDPNGSVFDGAQIRAKNLQEDAKDAMEHLISKWPGKFDKNNIDYQDLVRAIGAYNGPGNSNCSSNMSGNQRDTRWREGGQCPAQFAFEDHPHPLAWIDERHANMDLIFCMDFAEYSCQTDGTEDELRLIESRIRDYQAANNEGNVWSEEKISSHLEEVKKHCFSSSDVCQNQSDGGNYPKYERPGSITTAILLNAAEATAK